MRQMDRIAYLGVWPGISSWRGGSQRSRGLGGRASVPTTGFSLRVGEFGSYWECVTFERVLLSRLYVGNEAFSGPDHELKVKLWIRARRWIRNRFRVGRTALRDITL